MPSFALDTTPVIVCVKDETENTSALSLKRQYILLLVVSPLARFTSRVTSSSPALTVLVKNPPVG